MRLAAELDAAVRRHVQEMVELAEQGERTLAQDPESARALFGRIESAGRATLDEMRGLLGVLRSDEPPERAPQPTLAQLDALLRTARAGGRVVDLDVEGERRRAARRASSWRRTGWSSTRWPRSTAAP